MGNATSTPPSTPPLALASTHPIHRIEVEQSTSPTPPQQGETKTTHQRKQATSYFGSLKPATPSTPVASSPSSTSASSLPSSSSSSPSPIPPVVSLHSLAPPPPLSTRRVPTGFTSFLPVIGGMGVIMAGSVAYGVRYGNKQATKIEENYSQYEVKPKAEAEIEITPEMRRYALRRATLAFGYGTALTLSVAAITSYGVSRYWEVYSIPQLSDKLTIYFRGVRLPFEATANRIVDRFNGWVGSTWFGRMWSNHTGPKFPIGELEQIEVQRQNQEISDIWAEAKKMRQEWADGKLSIIGSRPKPDKVDTTTITTKELPEAKQ